MRYRKVALRSYLVAGLAGVAGAEEAGVGVAEAGAGINFEVTGGTGATGGGVACAVAGVTGAGVAGAIAAAFVLIGATGLSSSCCRIEVFSLREAL